MPEDKPKTGIELIAAERQRQIDEEGYTAEHDDYCFGQGLAMAAGCYVDHVVNQSWHYANGEIEEYTKAECPGNWPAAWDEAHWKPKDPLRDLVRAGALIAAEIDRRIRADRKAAESELRSVGAYA